MQFFLDDTEIEFVGGYPESVSIDRTSKKITIKIPNNNPGNFYPHTPVIPINIPYPYAPPMPPSHPYSVTAPGMPYTVTYDLPGSAVTPEWLRRMTCLSVSMN